MTYIPVMQHERYGIGVLPPYMQFDPLPKVYEVAPMPTPLPRYHLPAAPEAGIFTSIAAVDRHVHDNLHGRVYYGPNLTNYAGNPHDFLQGDGHLVEDARLSNPRAGGGIYLFSSDDPATIVAEWERHYLAFLDIADRYRQQPKDFYLAYTFLRLHPIFYHRQDSTSDRWEQQDGLAGIYQVVMPGDKPSGVRFLLEHGPYDDDTHVQSTHDHWLDAVADSYEAAIISMAEAVNERYTLLGLDR